MRAASLRLRLGLAGLVFLLAALGLAAFGLSQLFATHVERRAEIELTQHFDQLIAGLTRSGGALAPERPLSDPRAAQVYGGLYWQIDRAREQSRSRSLWDATLPAVEAGDRPRFLRMDGPHDSRLLARVQDVVLPNALGGGEMRVTVALDTAGIDDARADFIGDMIPYLALLAAVLIGAGSLQIHLGLRPLAQLRERVGGLRSGQARRMGGGWPLEVQPLTTEVDALLDQHEEEVEKARNRAADLAHGLKTPLQAILGEAGRLEAAGQSEVARSLEDLVGRLRRQVDAELARARFDGTAQEGSNLHRAAQGVLSVLGRVPDAEGLMLRNDIPRHLMTALAADELVELIGVLAENAVRHARSEVRLAAIADGAIALTIEDDGPGLPPDQRYRLLGRGARLDEDGSGLGLAIARGIVSRRRGTMRLEDAASGGLRVTLTLPFADEV